MKSTNLSTMGGLLKDREGLHPLGVDALGPVDHHAVHHAVADLAQVSEHSAKSLQISGVKISAVSMPIEQPKYIKIQISTYCSK